MDDLHPIEQSGDKDQIKPKGLWFSYDGDDTWHEKCVTEWHAWCHLNDFWKDRYIHLYEIVVHKDANILHFQNMMDVVTFFEMNDYWYDDDKLKENNLFIIDWRKLAEDYDGFQAPNYVRDIEMFNLHVSHLWYYGLDAPSGCIWNIDAIKNIKFIQHVNNNIE